MTEEEDTSADHQAVDVRRMGDDKPRTVSDIGRRRIQTFRLHSVSKRLLFDTS